MPDMTEPFAILARFNLWATHRLCMHLNALTESDDRGHCGLFFHTVHGTVNRLLVASQLICCPRLAPGQARQAVQLSDEVEPDRTPLRQRLIGGCVRLIELVNRFSNDLYRGRISDTNMRGAHRCAAVSRQAAAYVQPRHRQLRPAHGGYHHAWPSLPRDRTGVYAAGRSGGQPKRSDCS